VAKRFGDHDWVQFGGRRGNFGSAHKKMR
jgi:hypothetical protein